jgi:hypothetical protein
MTHDPMCRHQSYPVPSYGDCICDRLRACRARTLDEARAAVMPDRQMCHDDDMCPSCDALADALAAIDALRVTL